MVRARYWAACIADPTLFLSLLPSLFPSLFSLSPSSRSLSLFFFCLHVSRLRFDSSNRNTLSRQGISIEMGRKEEEWGVVLSCTRRRRGGFCGNRRARAGIEMLWWQRSGVLVERFGFGLMVFGCVGRNVAERGRLWRMVGSTGFLSWEWRILGRNYLSHPRGGCSRVCECICRIMVLWRGLKKNFSERKWVCNWFIYTYLYVIAIIDTSLIAKIWNKILHELLWNGVKY